MGLGSTRDGSHGCLGCAIFQSAASTAHTISGVRPPIKTLGVVFYRVRRHFPECALYWAIAQFFDIPREPSVHAGVRIETRIHGLFQRLSCADADDFNTLKMTEVSCVRFARTLIVHSFFSSGFDGNIFFGKHRSGQAKYACKKRQSKPAPGSCLRPGAMCS